MFYAWYSYLLDTVMEYNDSKADDQIRIKVTGGVG